MDTNDLPSLHVEYLEQFREVGKQIAKRVSEVLADCQGEFELVESSSRSDEITDRDSQKSGH